MLVITRWRVPLTELAVVRPQLETLRSLLEASGATVATLARNVDDQELWALVTHWPQVGKYRRALSSYEAKLILGPIMAFVVDEPSAYEPLADRAPGNEPQPRSLH